VAHANQHPEPETRSFGGARDFWDRHAGRWTSTLDGDGGFYARRAATVVALAVRHAPPGAALDVGCGSGRVSRALARRGFDVFGTDLSPVMVEQAIALSSDAIADASRRFAVCHGASLPFAGPFGLVTAIGVFPYVADYGWYLDLLRTRLAPHGTIIASSTNRLSLFTALELLAHLRRFRAAADWRRVFVNLARTGLWSGGFVGRDAHQCRRAADFDALFAARGFVTLDAVDFYNVPALDLDVNVDGRRPIAGRLARRLGWCHVGVYRATGLAAP
jgi:SAM-dependent methyltransferase